MNIFEILRNQELLNQYKEEQIYVAKTTKGYLIGDNLVGVTFTDNWCEARQFTETEVLCYKNSIEADLEDFYDCNLICFQPI